MTAEGPDLSRLREEPPVGLDQSARDSVEAEELYLEREAYEVEIERAQEENEQLKQQNEDLRQDRSQRKLFSILLFGLVAAWLVAVMIVIGFEGASETTFNLSDIVLTTLIGTTTASVLGLFLVVARYLFPPR